MCGICGFINRNGQGTTNDLLRMNEAIRHRGPDDEGYALIDPDKHIKNFHGSNSNFSIKKSYPSIPSDLPVNIGLGFSRLSIIDLSENGHQPMINDPAAIAIIFNGEIYNYKKLREELENNGYTFRSKTDTEVILKGYEYWGIDIVYRLNGMFAFAILDLNIGKLWLVRDRLGIKPLNYHKTDYDITWASEIKSILRASWVRAKVNWQGLLANYYLQSCPSPITCFENINSVQPGSWLETDIYTLQTTEFSYWKIPLGSTNHIMSLPEAAESLNNRLTNIIEQQLQADVPIMSLMSGGIDSTTLTAIAHNIQPSLSCYSLGFNGQYKLNELQEAKAMAKRIGIEQKIHIAEPEEVLKGIEDNLRHFEEPYSSFEVNIAASEFIHDLGYKVIMHGNGADEVFGGYGHILKLPLWNQRMRWRSLQHFIPPWTKQLRKIRSYWQDDEAGKYFVRTRESMHINDIKALVPPHMQSMVENLSCWIDSADNHFRDAYEAFFYYELKYSVASHHVYRDDMSAMKYSTEMRYPYLDHELIEWVANLPLTLRYNGKISKPLLRQVAAHYINAQNLNMPKKGFSLPVSEWMNENPVFSDFISAKLYALKQRGIFNNKIIDQWWKHRKDMLYNLKLWQLATTEIWFQEYID